MVGQKNYRFFSTQDLNRWGRECLSFLIKLGIKPLMHLLEDRLTTTMATKSNYQSINTLWMAHFILLLQEVTLEYRSFLPAGWLKGPWGSRQQLNNRYWVTYKSFICCDQVQLEFEPWTEEDSNVEIYFLIRFHK